MAITKLCFLSVENLILVASDVISPASRLREIRMRFCDEPPFHVGQCVHLRESLAPIIVALAAQLLIMNSVHARMKSYHFCSLRFFGTW